MIICELKKLREYNPDKDFDTIKNWISDERTHALWCANRTKFPLDRSSFDELLEELNKYGIREYAVSETQKYGHVTYFWNGNRIDKFNDELETYEKVDSDIISFDKAPKMKSYEITDKLIDAIKSDKYDFLRINFPNGDMVGHTGVLEAAEKACKTVDICVGKIADKCKKIK